MYPSLTKKGPAAGPELSHNQPWLRGHVLHHPISRVIVGIANFINPKLVIWGWFILGISRLYHIKLQLHHATAKCQNAQKRPASPFQNGSESPWMGFYGPKTPGFIRQESPVGLHQVVIDAVVHLVSPPESSRFGMAKKKGWNLLKPRASVC